MNIISGQYSRQSFLGPNSQERLARTIVGIVGLGGGGSHIAQQLAHVGIQRFHLFDADHVEKTNLNRLVGAYATDAECEEEKGNLKVNVTERLIKGISNSSVVHKHASRWQEHPGDLRSCDIVFGCVDGFAQRAELEACTRRYLIPLIDIGMDVHPPVAGQPYRMAGQVIVSMPGKPCMRCLGFLTEAAFAREAEKYGAAGDNPQVVWANGVLASAAVGLAVDILTNWTRVQPHVVYLSYDGNNNTLQPHSHMDYAPNERCPHFPLSEIGDPIFHPR